MGSFCHLVLSLGWIKIICVNSPYSLVHICFRFLDIFSSSLLSRHCLTFKSDKTPLAQQHPVPALFFKWTVGRCQGKGEQAGLVALHILSPGERGKAAYICIYFISTLHKLSDFFVCFSSLPDPLPPSSPTSFTGPINVFVFKLISELIKISVSVGDRFSVWMFVCVCFVLERARELTLKALRHVRTLLLTSYAH